jgi:hypothetical protein
MKRSNFWTRLASGSLALFVRSSFTGWLLVRRGKGNDLDNAQEILGELYEQGERDPETLGIYGRTWMDRYATSGDISDLRNSRDLYADVLPSSGRLLHWY